MQATAVVQLPAFLSTLSLRRATMQATAVVQLPAFLSTLSLRRATLSQLPLCQGMVISIHALLAESDTSAQSWKDAYQFLSTLSLRRATALAYM